MAGKFELFISYERRFWKFGVADNGEVSRFWFREEMLQFGGANVVSGWLKTTIENQKGERERERMGLIV